MKNDKLIAWLIVAVVMMAMVLVGLLAYTQGWFGKIQERFFNTEEKYVVAPGTPKTDISRVNVDSTILPVTYTRGLVDMISETELVMDLSTKKVDGSVNAKSVIWKIDNKTTVGCINDLIPDGNGKMVRTSELFIQYKDTEAMILKTGLGLDWMMEQVKKGQPVMVFGDDTNTTARTIYLFIDKCP